jgi:hypothetical protein
VVALAVAGSENGVAVIARGRGGTRKLIRLRQYIPIVRCRIDIII